MTDLSLVKNDEYNGKIQAIGVSFGAPVVITGDQQRRLTSVLDEICDDYEKAHPGRVMWVFGVGQKMLCHPMALSDDEPIPFDESVFSVECYEREK